MNKKQEPRIKDKKLKQGLRFKFLKLRTLNLATKVLDQS